MNVAKIQNLKAVLSEVAVSKIDWLFLSLLIFIPRLLHLDAFLTADEPLFLAYARDFSSGLASGDWGRTLGIGYPAVTLAWCSAPVVGLASTELAAYTLGRLATALATGVLLIVLYSLARLLLGRWPALLGVGLLALDPYALSYSRLFHIEAPLALFMTLAGLTLLLWLRDGWRPWLLLAGLFSGLALLTKSTALLLGPMLVSLLLGWAVVVGQRRQGYWWLRQIGALLAMALIAAVVFYALWPAMWSQPVQALSLTFGKLLTDQEAGAGNLGLFWLGRFVEDPGPAFYAVAFLLKATPWLLVGLALSGWQTAGSRVAGSKLQGAGNTTPTPDLRNTQYAVRPSISQSPISNLQSPTSNLQLPLWLFALTYLILMTIASKKSIRYMLPAFPTFYLLAGLAFYQVMPGWKFASSIFQSSNLQIFKSSKWLFTLLFILAIALLPLYHPYYLTYYNPLLLGWRWAPQTLLVGWGEGLEQAAAYLEQGPHTTVAAWYEWLFPLLYAGPVEAVTPQENLVTADKTVLYINQVQRDIPSPNLIHYFRARRQPEYTVRLAGIDYAWVYPGPIAGMDQSDPRPAHPLGGQFGGEVQLLGYNLHPSARSGEPLIVTLYWRILTRPLADRFVYLRLGDSQGRIWARADSPPVMGLWPVGRWQPGMLIEDAQSLPIPAGTPPGTYRLEVGLYDPTSGQTLPANGQPTGQGGGLLLGEVAVEWQAVSAEPDLSEQIEVRLAANAYLVGYSLPFTATTGDLLPVQLAWREATSLSAWFGQPDNDLVMFEWRQGDQALAEQLDSLPLPIEQWGRRALLRSQHQLMTPPALTSGSYELWLMLHDGSAPAGDAFQLGRVQVTAPPHDFGLPAAAQAIEAARLGQHIALVGYHLDVSNLALNLVLYWQTNAPLSTRYKVFVQLLAAENKVATQADSFPAAGQRPTTGWLPQEIITDAYRLALPPDLTPGSYRLIAGFYNPLTGERLPRLDAEGEVVGDFIVVAEVTLP